MTKDKAIERVGKLRAICVERGATEHEAATATALADQIAARYGVDHTPEPRTLRPQVARYANSAGTDRRSPGALRFVGSA